MIPESPEVILSSHLVILAGDDTVSRERAKETILRIIEKEHHGMGHERFNATEDDFSAIMETMLTASLFQEVRVFHFSHSQELDDGELKELDLFFKNPLPDVYVFVEIDEAGKPATKIKKALHADLRSKASPPACVYAEFVKPPDYKIAEWLVTHVPLLVGRRIGKADADYLADRVGYDVDLLHSELQKIDIHLPERAPITRQAIEEITGAAREVTPFELADAIGKLNFPRALSVIGALFAINVYPPLILSAIARHFWALFRIRMFARKNPETMRRFKASLKSYNNPDQTALAFEIGQAAGLLGEGEQRKIYPVIIKSGIVEQAHNFTSEELSRILAWLLEFDCGMKTGKVDQSEQSFELLCFRIVRIRYFTMSKAAA